MQVVHRSLHTKRGEPGGERLAGGSADEQSNLGAEDVEVMLVLCEWRGHDVRVVTGATVGAGWAAPVAAGADWVGVTGSAAA